MYSAMKVPIGEWIQSQRSRCGLTQADVARACKTDVGSISRWERGQHLPSADALPCLFELFGVKAGFAMDSFELVAPNAKSKKAPSAVAHRAGADRKAFAARAR